MKDANGQQLAYLYFEDEPQRQMSMKRLSRDEAFLIAVNIAKLPSVPRHIEGHSAAAKFGQPGRLSASVNVRCAPESDRLLRCHETARWAKSRHSALQQESRYSITSSVRASSVGDTVRPSSLAVLRLITNSNLVGCSTGISLGLAPRKILSANSAA